MVLAGRSQVEHNSQRPNIPFRRCGPLHSSREGICAVPGAVWNVAPADELMEKMPAKLPSFQRAPVRKMLAGSNRR